MDIVTKKLINILIQLAEADKHFAKAEREMIMRIGKEKDFPEDLILGLIKNPEPIESLGALSLDQKFEYLYSSIELIYADHNIFDSEVLFAKNISIKLGFKKDIIDYFVENYSKKSREEFKTVALKWYV